MYFCTMSKDASGKFDISLLQRIFTFTAPYKKKFYWSVVLAILLAIMAPLRPFLIQITINEGIRDSKAAYFLSGPGAFLIEITIIQIVLLILESIARFSFTFTSAALGQNVVKDLRNTTYKKVIKLNLAQFDRTPIGTLTTRTINDIESVNDIFSEGLIPIIADLLAIFSVLAYMFYTDWMLTLVCLAVFPVLIIATYYFKESVNKSFIKVRNAISALNAFVQEHISGMWLVQAFAAENTEQKKFEEINKRHLSSNIRAIFAYSVFFPIVELISAVSIGLLVWWAAKESVLPMQAQNVAGIVTSFILCLNLLFRPLRVLADKFNVLQMGMIASERVFKVLDNTDTTENNGTLVKPLSGDIKFDNVWFAYSGDKYVLKDVSFNIEGGKTLAIVGSTGSGKTTIVSLLNRLYHVTKGDIFISGEKIEDYELDYLRSNIGVVLQDVFLFSGSVRDNLTLRNPDISDEQVIRAAKLIGLHEFILRLPGGYDFNVMERGATLSMGQRQLLSFARAILYNPSILILDEATSSIDAASEQLVENAIGKLITGRTSIVIAHRLSTIRKADKILVMDKGEVKEIGSHNELIEKKGIYYKLYQMQFSKNINA